MKSIVRFVPAVATFALATTAVARGADFSPQAVFALPAHAVIDDRCGEARKFADAAGKDVSGVEPGAAVAAAKAFVACAQMQRLTQDADENRYYLLAAATALYLAGTKTTPATTLKIDGNADGLASQLGGVEPDPMYSFSKVEGNAAGLQSSASDDQQAQNIAHAGDTAGIGNRTIIVADRNIPRASNGPAYAGVASDLRIALAKSMATARAASSTATVPAATAAPAPSH